MKNVFFMEINLSSRARARVFKYIFGYNFGVRCFAFYVASAKRHDIAI